MIPYAFRHPFHAFRRRFPETAFVSSDRAQAREHVRQTFADFGKEWPDGWITAFCSLDYRNVFQGIHCVTADQAAWFCFEVRNTLMADADPAGLVCRLHLPLLVDLRQPERPPPPNAFGLRSWPRLRLHAEIDVAAIAGAVLKIVREQERDPEHYEDYHAPLSKAVLDWNRRNLVARTDGEFRMCFSFRAAGEYYDLGNSAFRLVPGRPAEESAI